MSAFRSGVGWASGAFLGSTLLACSALTSFDGLSGGLASGNLVEPFGDGAAPPAPGSEGGSSPPDAGLTAVDQGGGPTLDATVVGSDASANDATASDANGRDAAPPNDAGSVDACVPTALACDGKVHACNGVVDQGCPSALTIGAAASPTILGGDPTTGGPFADGCPVGQFLIGLGGSTGQWMDSIWGICGSASLQTSTASTPYTYAVTITSGAKLPTRGTVGADPTWQVTCAPNQAVVGIAGHAGVAMDNVVLSCAPLLVTGSPGSFALQQGPLTALPSQGDTGGGSPFTPVFCPSPRVFTLISGTAGQWLNSLGVACATPAITLIK